LRPCEATDRCSVWSKPYQQAQLRSPLSVSCACGNPGHRMATEREYILFCDESDRSGAFYSNFYGGVAVGASHYQRVTDRLNQKKAELHLFGEVKWESISEPYANKYIALMETFFEAVATGQVRVRIMFRQSAHVAPQLTTEQRDNEFFLLYYQFLKHGFGVAHLPPAQSRMRLRLYFDQFPDTSEKAAQFKGFLLGLQRNPAAAAAGVDIFPEDITEVRSGDLILEGRSYLSFPRASAFACDGRLIRTACCPRGPGPNKRGDHRRRRTVGRIEHGGGNGGEPA